MTNIRLISFAVAALAIALCTSSGASADTPTPSPTPQPSSDIVLVMNDSYTSPEVATISLRNDGQVAYTYNPAQPQCDLKYAVAGGGREFRIPSAVHCDLPGQTAELAPGASVQVAQWDLSECTIPGFFCMAVRPLETGQYTISGSLRSTDGQLRAQFSKTVSITGPAFTTTEIVPSLGVIVSDPPQTGGPPAYIRLTNASQRPYSLPRNTVCSMDFLNPDGFILVIPQQLGCDDTTVDTLAAGSFVDIVQNWKFDKCTDFGAGVCVKSERLPAGNYGVSGALWSVDKTTYAEFTLAFAVPAAPSPPLPNTGGPPSAASTDSWIAIAAGLAMSLLSLAGIVVARSRRSGC
jgi:hypothetical protein